LVVLHYYQKAVNPGAYNQYGGPRGGFDASTQWADLTGALVVTISSPGMGYNCPYEPAFGHPEECTVMNDAVQISHGETMTSAEFRDGFTSPVVVPRNSLLYSYAHSAMRAVTMVEKLFESDNGSYTLHWANGHRMMMGFSGGSVTTLIVNGVDDRLDGVIANFGMGAFKDSWKKDGAWLATVVTWDEPTGNHSDTIDCDASPTGNALAACRMANWMDPINYTPNAPIMLNHGSQDEHFPIAAFRRTRDTLRATGQDVYTFLTADMDHKYYPNFLYSLNPCAETYWNVTGGLRIVQNIQSFFIKGVDGDLDDFGDQAPSIAITVTGTSIKRYQTAIVVDDGVHVVDENNYLLDPTTARIGFSSTDFFHVYPGLVDGEVSTDDIPAMAQTTPCSQANHLCFYYNTYYDALRQPSYYGSFGQVNYVQPDYGAAGLDLAWHLTADIASAGTGGYNAYTVAPDIRCTQYNLDCSCADVCPAEEDMASALLDMM
jgi:hypothetical protein